MTRISRIISVICCLFYGQRIARITRNYFFLSPDEPDEPDGLRNDYLVNLVNLVIIFQTLFALFVVSVGKILICYWINFCPQSPKPMNSRNSLIIIDITSYIPIKSPKIHRKSLLLYIFFANFLSFPFSKLPDPNDVVSSINVYCVNNWHLVSYMDKKATEKKEKMRIKCLISTILYIFFVLCARIGI